MEEYIPIEEWGKYSEKVDKLELILPELNRVSIENNAILKELKTNPLLNGVMTKHLEASAKMQGEFTEVQKDVSEIKTVVFEKGGILDNSKLITYGKWIIGVLFLGLIAMGGNIIVNKYSSLKTVHDTTIIIS